MIDKAPSQLPIYLKSFEAFRLGEYLSASLGRSVGRLNARLNQKLVGEGGKPLEVLLLCELIAESIGLTCWDRCWNVYLSEFLHKSKYVADPATIDAALKALDILQQDSLITLQAGWTEAIELLKRRLKMPSRKFTPSSPFLSKAAYKKLAIGFNCEESPFEAFGLVDDHLVGVDPSLERALEATALRVDTVKVLNFGYSSEPTYEMVEATRLVLHRFRPALREVRSDAWLGNHKPAVTQMSFEYWKLLINEIIALKKLDCFESFRFSIDEPTATTILDIPSLRVFRVSAHETNTQINQGIKLGKEFTRALLRRGPINVVDIPHIDEEDLVRVLMAKSDLILMVNGRAVELPKTVSDQDSLKKPDDMSENAPQADPITENGLTDPFYPFEVSCSKEDGIETATVGFGVFSKYDWAFELESLDDYYFNGYGIAGLLQAIIHDKGLSEKVESVDAEGSDVLVTLNSWKAAKSLGKLAAKALGDEKKLRQLIARARELGFED